MDEWISLWASSDEFLCIVHSIDWNLTNYKANDYERTVSFYTIVGNFETQKRTERAKTNTKYSEYSISQYITPRTSKTLFYLNSITLIDKRMTEEEWTGNFRELNSD